MCMCVHASGLLTAPVWQPRNQHSSSDLIVAATSAGDNTLCCVDHTLPADFTGSQDWVRVGLSSWSMSQACEAHLLTCSLACSLARPLGRPSSCQGLAGVSVVHTAGLTTHITQHAAQKPKGGRGICG